MNIELSDQDIERVAKRLHHLVSNSEHYSKYYEQCEATAKANAEFFIKDLGRVEIRKALEDELKNQMALIAEESAKIIVQQIKKEDLKKLITSAVSDFLDHKIEIEIHD